MNVLSSHTDEIIKICKDSKVKSLFAFGSAVTGQLHPDSDIDLVVEIDEQDPLLYADNYFNLKFALEELLQRPVDLLEQKAIRNSFLSTRIDETKALVYAE